jgi:hypothetical protein
MDVADVNKILVTYQCVFNHLINFTIFYLFSVHGHAYDAIGYVRKHVCIVFNMFMLYMYL